MEAAVEAPQQYKQPSRKGKKAWRKNVDVLEIEAGLELVREEVIAGGVIAEKSSDALFAVDTTGSDLIQKAYNKLHKPLKVDQILAARSAVPPVDSHKRPRVFDGVIEPNSKRRKSNGVSHKEYQRLRSIAYGGATVTEEIIRTDGAPDHDPWDFTNGEEIEQDTRFSYLEKPKPIRAPQTLKQAPISLVAGTDAYPAVAKPRAGTSYNPVFQDWDQLLVEEGEKEVEAEIKRLAQANLAKERLRRIAAAQEERAIQTEDESAWEGFDSEYEGAEWLKKRRPERKTPTERSRVNKRKAAERQSRWDHEMKKRAKQAQQIRDIAKQVEADAQARIIAKSSSENNLLGPVDDRRLRRRKLGKH